MMLCEHANSPEDSVGEGTLMLVNSGPERESRLFPAPMSCVSKKEAAPALPGGPSLLACPTELPGWALGRSSLSRPAEKRLFSDKVGESLALTLAGEN